jgi:hypothetical protein
MFELIKTWYEVKVATLKRERDAVGLATDLMESSRDELRRDDAHGGWELIGSAYKGNFGDLQQTMVGQARIFARTDPNARAAIMGLLKYVMGRGLRITPKSQDPRLWYIWREFTTAPRNRWYLRQFEIVKRLIRDGEVFIRRYRTKDETGGSVKTWKTTIRFVDPMDVRRSVSMAGTEADKMNAGIETDPNDVEKVLFYHIQDRNDPMKNERVPASEIRHYKFYADFDQLRGDSFLLPIMKHLRHYDDWLKYRIVLNKIRTAIVLVRKVTGSASQVSAIKDTIGSAARTPSGVTMKETIRPGQIYTANEGTDLKMESANINATDAAQDGRNIILQLAAGTGMPEYLFGDASNNNYASSLMAEAPFVKEVHFHQATLNFYFSDLYRWVIEAAVEAGKIEAPEEEDVFAKYGTKREIKEQDKNDKKESAGVLHENPVEIFFGCDVQWPEVIHRDSKETTEALALQRLQGWVDDKTAAELCGYEYEEVVRKQAMIEKDAAENENPLLKGTFSGKDEYPDEIDKEADDIASDLTDEEKAEILRSNDPNAVAMILKKKAWMKA